MQSKRTTTPNHTATLWGAAQRLLTFSILGISLWLAFAPQTAFAHAEPMGTLGTAQTDAGLVVDEALCGTEAYRIAGTDLCTHGLDLPLNGEEIQGAQAATTAVPAAVCVGDGVSGKRVQVMYVRTVDQPDRYPEVVEQIRTIAAGADAIYAASAQATGGHRRIRFVTNADCQLDVLAVELPAEADDKFTATVSALRTLGYSDPNRKYMLFVEAEILCGTATIKRDSQPGLENANNQQTGYARIDRHCWGAMLAAHELTHTLGGVQNDAPHTSGGWHCNDEYDVMCYADGGSQSAVAVVCADQKYAHQLDCNHDDYFHTNPPAGSYLASHWNVANSEFLLNLAAEHPATGQVVFGPTDGVAEITPSTAISLAITTLAAASETDDYISYVEFFQDGTLLDTVTTAPYTWTWAGANTPGTYNLSMVIYTHDDMRVTTPALTITVKEAPAVVNTIYLPIVIQ